MLTRWWPSTTSCKARTDKTNIWDVNLETDYHEEKEITPASRARG